MTDQTHPAVHAAVDDVDVEDWNGCKQTFARDEFDELVRPLEQASGVPLNEPMRATCRAAFVAYPAGVRLKVRDALERPGYTNRVGLFIKMLRDGDHVAADELLASPAPAALAEAAAAPSWHVRAIRSVDGRDEVLHEAHPDLASCEARVAELRAAADVDVIEVLPPRLLSRKMTARDIAESALLLEAERL